MDITDSESCSLDQTPAPATQTASPLSRAVKNLRNALGGERNEDDREGTTFRFVETEPEISALLEESFHGTVPLFLHDPWCPVSARAFREMEKIGGELATIDVSRRHDLSGLVERRTGVRHQSPQLIVLRDGIAIWDASHWQVTAKSLHAALGEAPGTNAAGAR